MELFIAADHRGFSLKNQLRDWLMAQGHTVTDLGPQELDEADDYPDYAFALAQAVAEAPNERRGIAVCGSGVGMAVAAGKVAGIRATVVHSPEIAAAARRDDNLNVLSLGADHVSFENAQQIITSWLTTSFSGEERHERRLQKIRTYEQNPSS